MAVPINRNEVVILKNSAFKVSLGIARLAANNNSKIVDMILNLFAREVSDSSSSSVWLLFLSTPMISGTGKSLNQV